MGILEEPTSIGCVDDVLCNIGGLVVGVDTNIFKTNSQDMLMEES